MVEHLNQMRFQIIDSVNERVRQITFSGGQIRISASGPVDNGAAMRLRDFALSAKIDWAKVYFDSPGGSLLAGLNLGRAIRELMFDTAVGSMDDDIEPKAVCASAAAYAYAGGLNRFYSEYGGKIGIHQFYSPDGNQGDIGDSQIISATLVAYLQEMGVDSSAFVRATQARGSEMIWLSPDGL